MILIVNTTSDQSAADEIKERLAGKGIEPEVIEASRLNISHCIGCNQCTEHCPQEIDIPAELHRIDEYVEQLKQM